MFRFLTRKLKGEEDVKKAGAKGKALKGCVEDPYAGLEPSLQAPRLPFERSRSASGLEVHAAACNNDVKMLEKLAKDGVSFNDPRPQAGRVDGILDPFEACFRTGTKALSS